MLARAGKRRKRTTAKTEKTIEKHNRTISKDEEDKNGLDKTKESAGGQRPPAYIYAY